MNPIGRVLVPLDARAGSQRAIAPARRLAERFGVEVDLVRWSFAPAPSRWAHQRVERHLQAHRVDRPVEVVTTSARNAGIAIATVAAERRAVVVMATHARAGVGRTILGSTAEEVLTHSTAPVVLVGPRVKAWEPTGRIVTGLDRSDVSERVLAPITDWARDLELPLELVEVIEPQTGPGPVDGAYLPQLAASMPSDITVRVATLHGDPAATLVRGTSSTDLLAVASHGRRGVRRAVLGSVAMQVVRRARCPVVVIGAAARVDSGPGAQTRGQAR